MTLHPPVTDVLDAACGRGSAHVRDHLAACASCRQLASIAGDPEATVERELAPGTTFDNRFYIERWVASGGMGAIYRAIDVPRGETVAIKVATQRDPVAFARFEREGRLLARLRHPVLVEYVTHGTTGGTPYLAMAWLDGIDLATRLAEREASAEGTQSRARLPVADVVELARRLAAGLEALHAEGVIHRDIKPSNVFLVNGAVAEAKLIDLGAAREEIELRPLTELGTAVGTAYYMAPEQVRTGSVTTAADLWALGCVLYECLIGVVAFGAAQPLAAMTRVLIDEPAPIAQLRPSVPADLAAIVHALLAKDAAARPTATQLRSQLGALAGVSIAGPLLRAAPAALVTAARFLRTFMFVRSPSGHALPASTCVARYGGQLMPLVEGTGAALVTFDPDPVAKDEATRAAQLALALRREDPELIVVLATGHADAGHDDASRRSTPLPAVVDHAITTLLTATPGEVRLDRTSARLIGDRFTIDEIGDAYRLVEERPLDDIARRLPKIAPMVGRQREMTLLLATFDECVDSQVARAIVITAPPGQGKSRLRHELLRELERRHTDVIVVLCRGEPLSAGSPFVMLAAPLRRIMGIVDGDAPKVMQAKLHDRMAAVMVGVDAARALEAAAFLGEIINVPFPDGELPALRAARSEPTLLAQHTVAALCDVLGALARQQPVVIVLDDLQWGDHPTIAHVEAVLRQRAQQPIMVLALARPELHDVFPDLWATCDAEPMRLRPLSPKAATQLARHVLGAAALDEDVDALVTRSEGNPFFLEELLQATVDGHRDVPGSVITVVQSRLRALPDDARRFLLAASVFGEVFCVDAAACVLEHDTPPTAEATVAELTRRELITLEHASPIAGRVAYRFRHSLLREAAYAMLVDGDRVVAHGRAASFLAGHGGGDPFVLAAHYLAAAQPQHAIACLLLATRQAVAANDMAAAVERAERAIAAGAQGATRGQLRELQTTAYYWLGQHADSLRSSREASDLLDGGSDDWYRAVGLGIASAARLNEFTAGAELRGRAERAQRHSTERVICLSRAAYQLTWEGRLEDADRTLALVGDIDGVEFLARAQLLDTRACRHFVVGDLGAAFPLARGALDAYLVAGDRNNALLERNTIGWGRVRCGVPGTLTELRQLANECAGRGAMIQAVVDLALALALIVEVADLIAAERILARAHAYYASVRSIRFQGWASALLGRVALARTDATTAYHFAHEATAMLAAHPVLLGYARAIEAQALASLGREDEALAIAADAFAITDRLGGQMAGELEPAIVLAELSMKRGDRERARDVVRREHARLVARVARFRDGDPGELYMALPDAQRIVALATELGV